MPTAGSGLLRCSDVRRGEAGNAGARCAVDTVAGVGTVSGGSHGCWGPLARVVLEQIVQALLVPVGAPPEVAGPEM